MTQSLPKLRGSRPGVVAALFTILLFVAGCGGNGSNTATPTPSFTPTAGAYAGTQNVTVSDTNQNATLYCTTDGSTPTTSSAQCANPTVISKSQTLNAVAIAPGLSASAVATASFTITPSASAPTVSGIGPASGTTAGGTSVTIIGTNFTSSSSVNFGTVAALSVTVNSATSITAISPAGTGSVHVTVTTSAGISATSTADLFTYSTTTSAPTVSGLSPNAVSTGSAGFTLTITGTNFVPGATVLWSSSASGTSSVSGTGAQADIAIHSSVARAEAQSGSTALTTTFVSSTQLQAVVPASLVATAGSISVVVSNPDGSSSGSSLIGSTFSIGAPAITGTSPTSVIAGSTGFALTVNGTNFASGSTVLWGSTALSTTLVSSTQLMAAVPASLITTAGTATLTVTDAAGTSSGTTFTVTGSTPVITALSTSSGPVGTSVTISGSNFGSSQGSSTVTFGGVASTSVISWNPGAIVATVPTGAITGNVVVTVNGNASNGSLFTLTPSITLLSPTAGGVGTSVTITGANFGSILGSVTFNGTTATISSWNNSSIATTVPAGATSGNVVVTVNEIASNGYAFTVYPQPAISQLQPTSAAVGSSVTITGTNFGSSQGSSTVIFPGTTTAASVTSWSSTQIVATVPTGATGSGNVVVTVNGVASAGSPFTVLLTPTISTLSTNTGAVGAAVTITGTNFGATQGTSTVAFNGTPATSITSWSDTSIVAAVPTGATTGKVVVTVNGVASAGASFTVPGSPEIDNLNPAYGLPGSSVTITGLNLGTTPGTVSFNGAAATVTSWSATSIVVTVPSGATTGNLTVTTEGVTTAGLLFTITPTISSLSQTTAAVGASVTITGTNFGSSPGTSTVTFPGTTTPASISSWSNTAIVATVPSDATGSGSVVVTVNGVSSTGSPFTVLPPPAISTLSPSTAAPGGADFTLTITGTNFDSTAIVNWGSTQLTPTNITSTQITVTVPAAQIATAGTADVTVTEDDGTSNSETFTIATFLSGTVLSGPASGGTPLNAAVQLYAAGTTGYGTGSVKIGSEVQTNATTGAFAITYDCSTLAAPGDQLYLVATGSTSGSVLMTALGSCSSLASTFSNGVIVNEATTIASAYALAQFATIDSTNGGIGIGAPATATTCTNADGWKSQGPGTCNYIGLKNAFAKVNNLVDIPSGTALLNTPYYTQNPGSGIGYNYSQAPQARVDALANALASCSNPTSGSCTNLFTATTVNATEPNDTLQAALNIAQNPGSNVSAIYGLIATVTPFGTPSYTAAPTDWTLAIVYQGAGLSRGKTFSSTWFQYTPTAVVVDGNGNIWVTDEYGYQVVGDSYGSGGAGGTEGLVAVFSNLGVPLSPSATSSGTVGGYTGVVSGNKSIINPQSIAIDQNGYAWIGNYPTSPSSTAGSVTVLDASGNVKFGSPYTNSYLMAPTTNGIAVDKDNNVWVSSANAVLSGAFKACGTDTNGNGPFGGSILALSSSSGTIASAGSEMIADYLPLNSTCPTYVSIDQNGNMWTYDNGSWTPSSASDYWAEGLNLFSTTDGSLKGGPFYSSYSVSEVAAIDSTNNGWFTTSTSANPFGLQFAKEANFAGSFSPDWGNSSSPNSAPTLYSLTGLNTPEGTLVLDGNSNAWQMVARSPSGLGGLFEVNNADSAILSPSTGYQGYDGTLQNPGTVLSPIGLSASTLNLAVDNSGNVWVVSRTGTIGFPAASNLTGTTLSEFVGIAAPVQTPLVNGLINSNNLGTKP